jgi:tripartite-type tricarboxylate transporter receptor subunit TctC
MTVTRFMLAAAAVLGFMTVPVHAQETYPAKPVRIILPFPTGPGFLIGQLLSDSLRDTFRQGVAVEPRSGAGGSIALEYVARSAPDGHTLFMATPILTIAPLVRPSMKLDATRDFEPIAMAGTIPNYLAIHPSVPAKNIKEFIREAQVKPGRITYGSSGPGSTNHLVTELFSLLANVKLGHVPYKSATFAVLDMVRGDVDMVIGVKTSLRQFIDTKQLRIIAVLSTRRDATLPDVPTAVEQGLPDFVAVNYYGLLAPRGTPRARIDTLSREFMRVLNAPQARNLMAKAEIDPVVTTPDEFAAFIRKEHAMWSKVVREANVRVD